MPDKQHEELIRRYWAQFWNEGRLEVVAELYSPWCIPNEGFSIEGSQANVSNTRASFPDFRVTIDEIFGDIAHREPQALADQEVVVPGRVPD